MSNITPEELEDMLDRAAKRGATAALREVGLHDDDARKDIIEMRNLLCLLYTSDAADE